MRGTLNHSRISWARALGCLVLLPVAAIPLDFSQQNPTPGQARQTLIVPEANRPPDKNDQMKMNAELQKNVSYEAANAERKRQLDDDTAHLLKLAQELKTEVDKSSKDTLSVSVVRKAEDIERLAHNVQLKMKLTFTAR